MRQKCILLVHRNEAHVGSSKKPFPKGSSPVCEQAEKERQLHRNSDTKHSTIIYLPLGCISKIMLIGFWVGLILLKILRTAKNCILLNLEPQLQELRPCLVFPACISLHFPACSGPLGSSPEPRVVSSAFTLQNIHPRTSLFLLHWGFSGSHLILEIGTLLSGLELDTPFCSWAQE